MINVTKTVPLNRILDAAMAPGKGSGVIAGIAAALDDLALNCTPSPVELREIRSAFASNGASAIEPLDEETLKAEKNVPDLVLKS